jgi:hypothetical protein
VIRFRNPLPAGAEQALEGDADADSESDADTDSDAE